MADLSLFAKLNGCISTAAAFCANVLADGRQQLISLSCDLATFGVVDVSKLKRKGRTLEPTEAARQGFTLSGPA